MDDFAIVSNSREHLVEVLQKIDAFLGERLKLTLNPKTQIINAKNGFDFCGYRIYKDYRKIRKRSPIKAAGYATDPEYANKLIEIIEQYKLTEFDGKTESQENQGAGAAGADAGKYYRVQAGAYRRKEGANLMAEQIKKTGHTDVFVRLLNGLYKVQVGAYTKKENAEATVKRLKAAGIVCFITYA